MGGRQRRVFRHRLRDDDVIVTHDSAGRLVECSPRPGLQAELTTAELEEAICDAISHNVVRAQAGLDEIAEQFRAKCEAIGSAVGQHRARDEMLRQLRRDE
jgi:hypothetical protein